MHKAHTELPFDPGVLSSERCTNFRSSTFAGFNGTVEIALEVERSVFTAEVTIALNFTLNSDEGLILTRLQERIRASGKGIGRPIFKV